RAAPDGARHGRPGRREDPRDRAPGGRPARARAHDPRRGELRARRHAGGLHAAPWQHHRQPRHRDGSRGARDPERHTPRADRRARWPVMPRIFLGLGALSGARAVVLGAFAAHGLKSRLSADALVTFETGARYHAYHALALLAVAWPGTRWPGAWTS